MILSAPWDPQVKMVPMMKIVALKVSPPLPLIPSTIMKAATRRLMKDYKELQADTSLAGISATPHPDSVQFWRAVICGPIDTPWEGGVFHLSLTFADDYPAAPPVVKFLSTIYHPNGTTWTFL